MPLAYLNTLYPSLTHTFIEREVRAVRARGIEVHTFSIRRPAAMDKLSASHQAAANETCYLLGGLFPLIAAVAWAVFTRPLSLVRAIIASQRLSPPGLKARVLHIAYLVEAARLAKEMRRRGLRHVHVHMANNGAAVAQLACRFDPAISYSLTIHGSAEFFHVDSWRLKEKAEGAAFVRCISNFCRSQVMAWTSPDAWHHYHIVHCGIDVDAFAPSVPKQAGPLRILAVGRLDPIKGYAILLEACASLSKQGIDWRLDMVGDGPMRKRLEQQIQQLGVADRVTLSGAVGQDRIQSHFDQADVMVISSFMEGVPVVLMEAMAKQVPVVATRVGGIPELVEDGITGRLVAPGSVDELRDALASLAENRQRTAAMGQPARRKIVNEFSLEQVGDGMAALFARYVPGVVVAKPAASEPTHSRMTLDCRTDRQAVA